MKNALVGALFALTAVAAVVALLWFYAPQYLPPTIRAENPRSSEYAPPVYRWRDDAGTTQLTDTPPPDGRPYEVVRIRADTNLLPSTAPRD